jgi:hypothetical protein
MDILTLFTELEPLVVASIPIVKQIANLVPNRSFKEVADAYASLGVPLARVTVASNDPQVRGDIAVSVIENLLMNLAVAVLAKLHPKPTSTLNSAVSVAVSVLKATAKPVPVTQQQTGKKPAA